MVFRALPPGVDSPGGPRIFFPQRERNFWAKPSEAIKLKPVFHAPDATGRLPAKTGGRTKTGVRGARRFPVLILEETVLFPGCQVNAAGAGTAGRRSKDGPMVLAVSARKDAGGGYSWALTGTLAEVRKGPGRKPVLHGRSRFVLNRVQRQGQRWFASGRPLQETPATGLTRSQRAGLRNLKKDFTYLQPKDGDGGTGPDHLLAGDDPGLLCDMVLSRLTMTVDEKQAMLDTKDWKVRLRRTLVHLKREKELRRISTEIEERVMGDLREDERAHYLREQMAAIQAELAELEGDPAGESMQAALERLPLPKMARQAAHEELERFHANPPGTPEYMLAHGYLSLIRDLPWELDGPVPTTTLDRATAVLEKSHFGLREVKDHILEYLAVTLHRGAVPPRILLLSGPPGVGKTSLGEAVAEALGRPFARISLGGVRDEAEIRGHQRTYIGSMPGRILNAMRCAGPVAPVILLDEIDKIGGGERSEVAAAMLEVLDREQNRRFLDHYLAVPFDLSPVLFIATCNDEFMVPAPLMDRMEVVTIPGYSDEEKVRIARRYMIPAIRREMDLPASRFQLTDRMVRHIMHGYTREGGVRQLRRELDNLGRRFVRRILEKPRSRSPLGLTPENVVDWLGPPPWPEGQVEGNLHPGVVNGLAWTSAGGEIMMVEVACLPRRSGKLLELTGNQGKVMQESASAVLSWLTGRFGEEGTARGEIASRHFHVHLPEAATPKDGPSAGLAMMCAIAGAWLGRSVPGDLAMTGEISLRGKVLPVGGIREKVLAAARYGCRRVILPAGNRHDLQAVPAEVKKRLRLVLVDDMEEVLQVSGLLN